MDEKITIIEGPPPTFEAVGEGWALSLNESPNLADVAITHLRTFNGPSLVERCRNAWNSKNSIYLEFRDLDGLEYAAPILAARTFEVEDGQLLFLWVQLNKDEVDLEVDFDDNIEDDFDDNPDFPDK